MRIGSRLAIAVLAPLCVAAVVGAQSATPPSIRAIASAPFPTAMVSSPTGTSVAWVQNAEGARSIWVADAPQYAARRVVDFTTDDGQELSELAFTADGRTLWFTRGSGTNRAGENPNPTSDPLGAEQAIWRVNPRGGSAAERVTDGNRATPAPVGDMVIFTRRGQVMKMVAPMDGEKPTDAPLFKMRGSASSMSWSPDGRKLAFVSERGTHSFVGVFDTQTAQLRWMAPSTDGDASPVWSPDGTKLAFLREPYETRRMIFLPIRTAQPWSIHVADVATGDARELFRADTGSGSAYWPIVSSTQLFWSADDDIVFPWERDGFVHLYSVPSSGGAWRQLDRGMHETEYVSLSHDRRSIIFNSNAGDRDRRHLWRVAANGAGTPVALTPGDGIEWLPTPLADGAVAHLRSDARVPAHAALLTGGARRALAPASMPSDHPANQLVVPSAVSITATDGVESYGQLFLPPASFTGKRPTIIFLHGGSRRQMLLGWNYGAYYHYAYALNQALALRGWVVLQLNYRSGIGYGRDFREALDYGASGASEYRDLEAAARWLRARADVDTSRVALWGGSYGGYLTAHGLTRNPELFAGGVDIHGVHDWNVGIKTFLSDYNRLEDPEAGRLAFSSSPLARVENWEDPVLLIHGDDDRNVRFIETLTLIERLRAQQVPVEQLVLPDEIHGFLRHNSWMQAYERSLEFLERRVVRRER